MSITPAFAGEVSQDGASIVLVNRPGFAAYRRRLAGKRVELVLRPKREKRSLDQNAYIHAVPVPLVAAEIGESINDTKFLMMGEKWGWHTVRGYQLPVKGHTSEMSTDECSEFIEWAPMWAMTEFGLYIPLPNECDW